MKIFPKMLRKTFIPSYLFDDENWEQLVLTFPAKTAKAVHRLARLHKIRLKNRK